MSCNIFNILHVGVQCGPFMISCREALHGSEQKVFWQVINKEICATTRVDEASTFYIQYKCTRKRFQIIHKTEPMQTTLYVLPEPQHRQPLKLVPSANQKEISFKLKNNIGEAVDPPKTMASWERDSSYFIQRPKRSIITKDKCYLRVKKQEHCDEQSKYTVAAAKKREMDNSLMLFYFTPTIKLHNQPVPIQPHRVHSDFGEVEDSRSRPDSAGSTLSGPPPPPSPPPIQQPENGSVPGNMSNELKDFFELVGEDYIFPIQVNAEGI